MENKGLTPETRSFFKNIKNEEGIDDQTFHEWKSELQNNLPEFWESMTKRFSR